MKKIVFFFAVLAASTITSCNTCYECDFNNTMEEICEKDYEGGGYDAFDIAIKAYEDAGYTCNKK